MKERTSGTFSLREGGILGRVMSVRSRVSQEGFTKELLECMFEDQLKNVVPAGQPQQLSLKEFLEDGTGTLVHSGV